MSLRQSTLIVVADGARASVYRRDGRHASLSGIGHLTSEAARQPDRELVSDGPGSNAGDGGGSRHGLAQRTDPHRHSKDTFARDVAEFITSTDREDRFDRLVIVAAPRTLGDLRKMLPPTVREKIASEVAKDLTHLNVLALEDHLRRFDGE